MNPYKAARRTAGLTQDQACERLYIGRSTIHRYEKGEPPIDVVVQMDRLYGCGGKLIRQRIENISFSRTKKKHRLDGYQDGDHENFLLFQYNTSCEKIKFKVRKLYKVHNRH